MQTINYSSMENTRDIGQANRIIRSKIRSANTKEKVTELKNKSKRLVSLSASPSWKKKYNIAALRKRAKEEYKLTQKVANQRVTMIVKQMKK